MLKNPNRKSAKIHLNVLATSEKDTIALGLAVEIRFKEVVDQWFQPPPRGRGEPLVPPVELNPAMLLWRQMRIRHMQGDLRNTADELKATKRIAEWTLRVKSALTGEEKTVEWKD